MVRRRLQYSAVFFAWFLATGAQWDLVQVFGWGRMLAGYSESMTLTAALGKTFGGEKCAICHAVDGARSESDDEALPIDALKEKLVLVYQPVASLILSAPVSRPWTPAETEPFSAARRAPPTPPPRLA